MLTPGLCFNRFESWWWRPSAPQGPSTWCPSLALWPATPPKLNFLGWDPINSNCEPDPPVVIVVDPSWAGTFHPGPWGKSQSHGCHQRQPADHVNPLVLKWIHKHQKAQKKWGCWRSEIFHHAWPQYYWYLSNLFDCVFDLKVLALR